jgi:hypothetical protein
MRFKFWGKAPAAPSGPYVGRLGWDSGQEFHTDASGEHFVVTDDEGKTWRYAEAGDSSHNTRYQKNALTVVSTAVRHAELVFDHGVDEANAKIDTHHFSPNPADPHFYQDAPGYTRLVSHPDAVAPRVTGHTEAYA